MTRDEVARRARLVIVRELGVDARKVVDDSDFRTDLGCDSLDMVELPRALEDEFKVELTDDDVAFCQTFGTAVDIIAAKIEAKANSQRPRRTIASGLNGRRVHW
jgi:acyl carrier protein